MRHRVTASLAMALVMGLAWAGGRSGPAAQAPAPLEWQDPAIVGVNKEPPHATFTDLRRRGAARKRACARHRPSTSR